ncbi:unnamed protein product [Polarella glacialis]|uniref:Uncharacterized protein n=1 Tax=Polarella glacialis TaxID=89957 RepID=A0A813DTW2_POLGL|nr:unnamed protein product [Polarella glacialis]
MEPDRLLVRCLISYAQSMFVKGRQPLRSVERYDPFAGRWEAMPQMMVARGGAGAGVINKRLYVCGGWDESRLPLSSVECFGPRGIEVALMSLRGIQPAVPILPGTHCWQAVPSMSQRRGGPAAAALEGLLYVCGGEGAEQREPLNSVERLTIVPHLWLPLPPLESTQRSLCSSGWWQALCVRRGLWDSDTKFRGEI